MSDAFTILAEQAFRVIEPVHALSYFAPETKQAGDHLGLKGYYMGYFAFRAAPMGPVDAAVVEATFFNFHRSRVERAIPYAWSLSSPEQLIEGRSAAVAGALQRIGVPEPSPELIGLARAAAESSDCAGRALAAANQRLSLPDDPWAALWQALTVLREHRGDGHVASLVHAGLGGAEALLLQAATGRSPRAFLVESRSWPPKDWSAALDRLSRRGLVGADEVVTGKGREVRDRIEADTNELAAGPYRSIGEEGTRRLVELVRPLAVAVVESGSLPFVNPIDRPDSAASA